MAFNDFFAPLTAFFKLITALIGNNPSHPQKRLEARLITRGIVAEIPHFVKYYICDEHGKGRYKGVYIIGLIIYNKGDLAITKYDFTESCPFQVKIGQDATLISTQVLAVEDQTSCFTEIINKQTMTVNFDCINPSEYLVVSIYLIGNPGTDIHIEARIIGQDSPIDFTAEEVKALLGERITALFLLILVINWLPGLFVAGWLILKNYEFSILLYHFDDVNNFLKIPFTFGVLATVMFVYSRVSCWNERRQYPKGYPLNSDLEPPLLENIRGLLLTLFVGKKQRVSLSLFNWGKPIIMPNKKVKRRSVDDWIQ